MDLSTIDSPESPKLLPAAPKLLPVPYDETDTEQGVTSEGYRVLLFNDDFHTVDEVAFQLVKALRCALDMAAAIMLRAHHNGKATVTITSRSEAERIAGVLREIALIVSVDRI